MSDSTIPCLVCGEILEEVYPGHTENQPSDGNMLFTHGTYGSTVFDPLDGSYLLMVLCDECLVKAGERGRVMTGRDRRPVEVHRMGVVGWERVDRPQVAWTKDLPPYDRDDRVLLDDPDELDRLPSTVRLNIPVEAIRTHMQKEIDRDV